MTSIDLGKMYIYLPILVLFKCNENVVLFSKTTQNKVKGLIFLEKYPFCYVMFGVCPYFLNKALDQVYSNKSRNCNPKNRIYIYI